MHFASPPERVYAALATAEGRAQFWAESATERNGVITFVFPGHPPVDGEILERDPPRIFELRYFGATVRFTLATDGAWGTDLLLESDGIDEADRMEVTAGWVSVLMAMKAAVDHGVDLRNHHSSRSWAQGYADN